MQGRQCSRLALTPNKDGHLYDLSYDNKNVIIKNTNVSQIDNKQYMKKFLIAMLAVAIVCSCGTKTAYKLVTPLPSGLEIDALTDCTVPAEFTCDDFRWMGGNLTMKVFSENLYDAVEVSLLEPGDTLLYDGEKIVVETIENDGGMVSINEGLDNGGAWLQAGDGGTFRATQFDDHSVYSELGTAELPLSENFRIIDCGTEPLDPSDTVATGQKLYLETLEGWRRDFSPLNTTVLIENGLITEIVRHWIP